MHPTRTHTHTHTCSQNPYYSVYPQPNEDRPREMSFVASIFSFVFGDGDPNASFEERRWQALGKKIQAL